MRSSLLHQEWICAWRRFGFTSIARIIVSWKIANSKERSVANSRGKKDVDVEVDLHGLTVEQLRHILQRRWPEWRGLQQVRIVTGRGEALKPEVERWSQEMGIPYAPDPNNPGSMRLFPSRRTLPDRSLGTTLREKGLRLTPEEETYLRDPQVVERARQEALRRKQEEEQRQRAEAASRAGRQRQDDALWQAEVARLDNLDRKRGGSAESGSKPTPPRIVPPSEMQHQEGYWRGELVRVADTDTDTLKKQKRTGLEKLAPPIEPKPTPSPPQKTRQAAPQRDTAADQALFESEMTRLDEFDPRATRRAKHD
jgi:hypothetical protein